MGDGEWGMGDGGWEDRKGEVGTTVITLYDVICTN